jgi:hypothetical protein
LYGATYPGIRTRKISDKPISIAANIAITKKGIFIFIPPLIELAN